MKTRFKKLKELSTYSKIAMSFAVIIVILVSALQILNRDRIILGVNVAENSLGFKKPNQAKAILQLEADKFIREGITITYDGLKWKKSPEELGITYDINRTVEKARSIGKERGIAANISRQFKGIFKKYNLPMEINWNEEKFNEFYENNLAEIDNHAQNARIEFKNGFNEFEITEETTGNIINKKLLINGVLNNSLFLSQAAINLEIITDFPEITVPETEIAQEIIKEISEKLPLIFKIKEEEWTVSTDDLAGLLEFPAEYPQNIQEYFDSDKLTNYDAENKILGVSLNRQKTEDYLTVLSTGINREPVNAELQIKNGRVETFALSQNGIKVKIKESAENFINSIKNREKNIMLEYHETEPEITTESIDNLGITAFIGKGESNFSGSPESRKHNIKVGSLKFHGTIIAPNEEFSFNEILGEVGPQTGYLPELVIKKDKTIPEYGGGLCQVSTTAFRAAVNAGLKITERFNHSFPVVYYSPQGFDATIYPPHPDLRFINNTEGHILIQTKVVYNNLIFEFYGTDDGRKVEIDGPYQYDTKPDGSMKAKLTQKVYNSGGELMHEKTFYSDYKSPGLYPIERNPLE